MTFPVLNSRLKLAEKEIPNFVTDNKLLTKQMGLLFFFLEIWSKQLLLFEQGKTSFTL